MNFQKFQLKLKMLRHFNISNSNLPEGNCSAPPPPPQQIKASYVSGTKMFERRFTGMYRHLFSKSSENAFLKHLEMVQCKCFSWHQPELWFWLCCGSIFLIMLSQLRFEKRVRWNCIVKWVIFFASLCWFCDFLN